MFILYTHSTVVGSPTCQFLQQNINSTVMVGPRSSQAVPVLEALKLVSMFQKVACAQSAADEASC